MINKTFRLFISSTFSDFIEERTILNNEIFPVIDEFCQAKGYNFQLIDLRWGVNNESALNQNTIAICLDEVRRCKALSPKPNFLIMAGERYGWIPLPSHIQKEDFEKLLQVTSLEGIQLLGQWYLLDENEIGGEYYLKTREGVYIEDNIWSQTEIQLHNVLLEGARKSGFSADKIDMLASSATEQEIVEGLLGHEDICNNVVSLFRTGYPEKDEDLTKINRLKNNILQRMEKDGCSDNIVTLEYNEQYAKCFYEQILEILKKNIGAEMERLESQNAENDGSFLSVYAENESNFFYAREDEMAQIVSYTSGEAEVPMFVTGESGSGKTTLLLEFIKRSQGKIFGGFFGADENSYTLLETLRKICLDVKTSFGIIAPLEMNASNISEVLFLALHSIPSEYNVVIVIDGLDMFYDIDSIHENVFPSRLPSNVKLIVSGADRKRIDRFLDKKFVTLHIDKFNSVESRNTFDSLMKTRNRKLSDPGQMELVLPSLNRGVTPLHLKLMTEVCSQWHSAEKISEFPKTAEEIALVYLTNMYTKFGHNKELFLYALALVSVAPYGVTEEELQLLLLQFPSVKKYFTEEDRYSYGLTKLPFVVWSRLFYDLKGCLTLARTNGCIVVKFVHQIFHRVFAEHFSDYCVEAKKVLTEHYMAQRNYINDRVTPNIRKALSLGTLLKEDKNYGALCRLYLSLSFIDSVIKIGNVDEVIATLQLLLTCELKEKDASQLERILECVDRNRDMLSCYCNTFYSCAYEAGLVDDGVPVIHRRMTYMSKGQIHFPYASESHVSWYKDQDLYAVFNNSYVYICSLVQKNEVCRIYLEPSSVDKEVWVRNAVWIDDHTVAVITNNKQMLIYDFADFSPNIISQYPCANDCVKVDYKHKTLLYIDDGNLKAIDPFHGNEKFSILLKNKSSVDFDLDDRYDQIILRQSSGKIAVYSSLNGEQVRQIKIHDSWSYRGRIGLGDKVHQISEEKWIIYTAIGTKLTVIDKLLDKVEYLHPPFWTVSSRFLFGRTKLVILSGDILLVLDLQNYEMKYHQLNECYNLAWKSVDKSISVVLPSGLMVIDLDDFNQFEDEKKTCMVLKRNLFDSTFLFWKDRFKQLGKNMKPFMKALKGFSAVFDYDVFFSDMLTGKELELYAPEKIKKASIVVFSNDGLYAAAYEEENTIVIYDSKDTALLHIDQLNLSIANGILKMLFSPDSRYILIWRNFSLQVIEIMSGKMVADIDVSLRPVFDVVFDDDSDSLDIILVDGNSYLYNLKKSPRKELKKLPKKLSDTCFDDRYFGPYTTFFLDDEPRTKPLLDTIEFGTSSRKWMNSVHIYYSGSNWLWLIDGEFYYNGNDDGKFTHNALDFNKSHQIEHLRDASSLKSFLRAKNDLFSRLIESNSGKYMILVSRVLNSIVVFDTENLLVIDAYKHFGNIIGNRIIDDNTIEIISDKEPYRMMFEINFP